MVGPLAPDDGSRLQAMIEKLREDVDRLQNKVLRIPTLQADPDASDAMNVWFMDDGRLRGRLRDGTVVEYARSNHIHPSVAAVAQGGAVATVAPPTAQYVPSTRVYQANADWVQCYNKNGLAQRTDKPYLFYGYYDSYNQEMKSMMHFAGLSALAPGPAGTRIASVYLRIINRHTNLNSGAELRIGLHNTAAKPGAFAETVWTPYRVHVEKAGYGDTDQTYRLPNIVGEKMRDGTCLGVTFDQNSTNRSYYGYAEAYANLKITYVK